MAHATIRSISHAKSIDRLHGIIKGLLAQECWKVAYSYGGELLLHFGARIPSNHPKMVGELEGEWIFSTCGTGWVLQTRKGTMSSTERTDTNEDQLERKLRVSLAGGKVSGLDGSKVLSIAFSNGCRFCVMPTADDDKYEDVPYWELFLPNHMMVAFGPGNKWSYKRSDVT